MTGKLQKNSGIDGQDNMTTALEVVQAPHFLTPDHLSLAASTGDVEIVSAIVEAGCDPSRPDALGETPLHHAARLGLADVMNWLIAHGASFDARNRDGLTPLELADEYGQSEIVRLLQSCGATVPFSWQRPKLSDAIGFLHFDLVEGDLRSHLLGRFAGLDGLFVSPDVAVLRAAELSFYSGTILVAVEDPNRHGLRERFVLVHEAQGQTSCSVLNWTNEPIYQWNERYGINLAKDDIAINYAQFFFCFVRGRHGTFTLVEQINDFEWDEAATDADRTRVASHLASIRVSERTDDFVRLRGTVSFKNALFQTDIVLALHACTLALPDGGDHEPTPEKFSIGQSKLLNEILCEEELPVHILGAPGLFG